MYVKWWLSGGGGVGWGGGRVGETDGQLTQRPAVSPLIRRGRFDWPMNQEVFFA